MSSNPESITTHSFASPGISYYIVEMQSKSLFLHNEPTSEGPHSSDTHSPNLVSIVKFILKLPYYLAYHSWTAFLFTKSDFKAIIIPIVSTSL